jgi:hypothetical protein
MGKLKRLWQDVNAVLGLFGDNHSPRKKRKRTQTRSSQNLARCFSVVRKLGIFLAELSQELGISPSGISPSVQRGERIAEKSDYFLAEGSKLSN